NKPTKKTTSEACGVPSSENHASRPRTPSLLRRPRARIKDRGLRVPSIPALPPFRAADPFPPPPIPSPPPISSLLSPSGAAADPLQESPPIPLRSRSRSLRLPG
uniref:Uncharacterized protein n=6 Tax=Aegilops tauschii subsp. strangulata TaxID=200361 RepID=A0A453F0D4_AEGTS